MPVVLCQAIELFADYHQFYVQDGGVNPPAPEDWTEQDVANRSKVADNVVVVCPLRNMSVPVEIIVHDSEPSAEPEDSDHTVECTLDLPTGHLQVHECTGPAVMNATIPRGTYRVRLTFRGLASISSSGLEGNDSYRVELWPGKLRQLTVTHRWAEPDEA